jgi:RHS repeat-associated protein
LPGDFDGDGFDDLGYQDATTRRWMVLRGSPYGFEAIAVDTGLGSDSDGSQAITADVDGDGRRDILVPGSGNYWHRLWRTSAGAWSYNATGVINAAPPGGLVAADVDGDGRDDLVYVKSAGDAVYWRRNLTVTSSTFANEAVLWSVPVGQRLLGSAFIQNAQRFRSIVRNGDFNGDGRSDFVVLTQVGTCGPVPHCGLWLDRWQVLASTGSALSPQYLVEGSAEPLLADFNGDGLTDIAYWGPGYDWKLLLAKGARGSILAGFADPNPTSAVAPAIAGRALVIDWDADGRNDLFQPASSGEYQHCRSNGTSLDACQPAVPVLSSSITSPISLDVNGDGYPDVAYASGSVRMLLHHQVPPDHLVSVMDGLGAQSTFEYAALSHPSVHRPVAGTAFPVRDVLRPGMVVAKATLTGSRGPQPATYFYEGARSHVQGRGFLGFARRTVTPTFGHLVRVEELLQDPLAFERVGSLSRITLQQKSGAPVSRTTFTWGTHVYGTGPQTRRFAYPSQVIEERFELDGVKVSSTTTDSTYDTFGTATQRQRTTTEHAKGINPWSQHMETVSLGGVVNDTTNWCLGRPATSQVTRQHSLPGGAAVTRSASFAWDYVRCRQTQQVLEPSSTSLKVTTNLAYNSYGNFATTSEVPVGQLVRTTRQTWSEAGRFLQSTTDPMGFVTTTAWDGVLALPTTVTDPNALSTSFQYDEFGRLAKEIRPDGTSTAVIRAACGGACAISNARYTIGTVERGVGNSHLFGSETAYDAFGREVYWKRELPGGAHSFGVTGYDLRGLVAQESIPAICCGAPQRWFRHAYDSLERRISTERPTSETVPTPVFTRWQHDGLVAVETDPLGRQTTRRHDALGHVLQVVDPALAQSSFEYDAFGNLLRVRDSVGSETVATFDVRGFRRSLSDPNAGQWTFDYFPAGELRSQVNPRGQATAYTYDRMSRPLTRVEPEGTTTWKWGGSASGRNVGSLTSVTAPGSSESYQYDSFGRLASVGTTFSGTKFVTSRTFDPVSGLPDLLVYPASTSGGPLRVRHHHDRGRLVRLSDADTAITYWQLNSTDAAGRVVDESLGNGVRIASVHDAVTGWLRSRTAGPGGGGAYQRLAFEWDPAGNLLQRDEFNHGVQERFYYDSQDRLDYVTRNGVVTLDLAYDAAGSLTYKSDVGDYTYDASRKQAVLTAGGNSYAYDASGAVTSASGTAIAWLSYDLPSQLTHPNGNYATFSYGSDRHRVRQSSSAGGVLADTVYAAGGLYERRTSAGQTTFRHRIVANGRTVAVQARASGAAPVTTYLLEDHLGGVDGLTSSSGELLARTSYQAFGARRAGNGTSGPPTAAEWQQIQAATSRGYTDHEHLDNLGLIHMNGRVYDPVLGRFLSPDPIVQSPHDTQGLNRYAYVRNNPLRFTDPTGYCIAGSAVPCDNTLIVNGSRLDGWRSGSPDELQELVRLLETYRNVDFRNEAESEFTPDDVPTIVVLGQRLYAPLQTSLGMAGHTHLAFVSGVSGPQPDDLLLAAGIALAVIEPTPVGETILLGRGAVSAAKGLATVSRGTSVLGHFPAYIEKAAELGARRFSIPNHVWEKMSPAERWSANQKFLDRLMARGDEVVLTPPLGRVTPGSTFERELQYMLSRGYKAVDDGSRLVPGH